MPDFVTDIRFDRSTGAIVYERRNYEIRGGALAAIGDATESRIPLSGVDFNIYCAYKTGVGVYDTEVGHPENFWMVNVKNTGLVPIYECNLQMIVEYGQKKVELPFKLEHRGVFPQLPGQTVTWYHSGDAKIPGERMNLQEYLAAQPTEGISLVLDGPSGVIGRIGGKDVIYWFEAHNGGSCEDEHDDEDAL